MKDNQNLLRNIPQVDDVLNRLADSGDIKTGKRLPEAEAVREVLDGIRQNVLTGESNLVPDIEDILDLVRLKIAGKFRMNLRNVINATGIILHTNLGRARLGDKAVAAAIKSAQNYSNLEYDIESGDRGSRNSHVEDLLIRLTGAEDAFVVNNNAAAVFLILNTVARNKEIIISRGEMVEIGASFRIPGIIEQSGGILAEVGTTNKTHLSDYESVIEDEKTAAILKVHTSNYKIVGFSETPTLKELAELGEKHNIPLIYDLGSGTLADLQKYGITDEPTVFKSVENGADIICFSGDKLLGGPQAGIIVGKKEYIGLMRKNQLARALRIDKLTLAALEATLRSYLEGTSEEDIPTLRMLSVSREILAGKADELCKRIKEYSPACEAEVIEEYSQVGGGSVPGEMLATFAVALKPDKCTVMEFEHRMRQSDPPIIARISKDRLLLDVRTLEESDFTYIAERISQCLNF